MSIFFKDYPKVQYTLNDRTDSITNLTSRFKVLDSVLQNVKLFYPYTVKENESPEMVSYRFYDTMEYHWIIMMFNQYIDPYFDWPMNDFVFNKYIDVKYGGEAIAKQQIHEYRHILQIEPYRYNIIDEKTYLDLDDYEREFIYVWDHEYEKNENRRFIQIPDSVYIGQILDEKARIYT